MRTSTQTIFQIVTIVHALVWVLNLKVAEIGNKHFMCVSQEEEDAEVEAKYAITGEGIIHKL